MRLRVVIQAGGNPNGWGAIRAWYRSWGSQHIHIRALRTVLVGVNHKVGDGATAIQSKEPISYGIRI